MKTLEDKKISPSSFADKCICSEEGHRYGRNHVQIGDRQR